MKEVLEAKGFRFSHTCKICKLHYDVYHSAAVPGIQVKVSEKKNYFRIYRKNQQIGYGHNEQQLKLKLEKYAVA